MPGDTAENDRNFIAALIGTAGIVGAADLLVTANGTPNMTVNVAAGAAFIKGTETTYQGVYHVFNDAPVSLAIAASDPTNPRIDIVVAQVRDAFYSGASNDFRLVVVTGTPAGAPAAPATPADSIVLARVAVAALVTTVVAGNITDYRVAALDSLPSPGLTPAPLGTLPGGYAPVIANQGPTAGPWAITGASITVTVGTGRRIRVSAQAELGSSVATDTVAVQIMEGASVLQSGVSTVNAYQPTQPTAAILTPSAGTHTYFLMAVRILGTGTLNNHAAAAAVTYILAEDIGV